MNQIIRRMKKILGATAILAAASFGTAHAEDSAFFTSFDGLDKNFWYVSSGWANGDHQACEWRAEDLSVEDNGLQMRLADNGGDKRQYGCAEMHTNKFLGYGLYEARIRVASGDGLNTAFFTFVGPPSGVKEHDEIDFEFLGKDTHSVQINYYRNAQGHHEVMVPLSYDASKEFHNYAFEWLPGKIKWYIDSKLVHETPAGADIPHNPGALFFSLWAGSSMEDAWLGHFKYIAPVTADVTWAAYTPVGQSCKFPQSMQCK